MSNVQRRDNSILQDRRLESRVGDLELWRRNAVAGVGGIEGPVGPVGPAGVAGAAGAAGAAGVAGAPGLTWRGTWAAGTAYAVNDAVSYTTAAGATNSYRRLVAGTTATTPDQDGINWALIVSGTLNVNLEPWHQVGAAGEPAFQASWANVGTAGDLGASFRKYPDGKVRLRGYITGGAANTIAFTLPVGYRPPGYERFAITNNNVFGMAYVAADGTVVLFTAGISFVDLSAIEFDTETVSQVASSVAQPIEPWHLVGAGGEPAFLNGWGNLGSGFESCGFRKFPDGRVRIKGTLARAGNWGAVGEFVFTLPAGYRPPFRTMVTARAASSSGVSVGTRLDIYADGSVSIVETTGVAVGFLAFDNVEFDTQTVNNWVPAVVGPAVVSTLPASGNFDGREVYFQDAILLAQKVRWRMIYDATAGVWEFAGGGKLYGTGAGAVGFTNTTVATGTSGAASLTVPALTCEYEVEIGGFMQSTAAGANNVVASLFQGSTDLAQQITVVAGSQFDGADVGRPIMLSLTAGWALTLRYATLNAIASNFQRPFISIQPRHT